ncbi:hypothetical protein KVP10_17760, partial [Candidimonas humi]|uniref:hypothetical protein n=1 Tax=Candidimonas humi TaxID=683355 RepID=UPI001C3E955F
AWLGLAWLGLAWLGLAWLGLAWLGLAWLGLAWLGLAWLGLAWHQLWLNFHLFSSALQNYVAWRHHRCWRGHVSRTPHEPKILNNIFINQLFMQKYEYLVKNVPLIQASPSRQHPYCKAEH